MEPSYTTRKWALFLWQKLSKFFLVYFSFDSASGLLLWHAVSSCLHTLTHLLFYGLRGLGHGEPGLPPPLQGWVVTLRIMSTHCLQKGALLLWPAQNTLLWCGATQISHNCSWNGKLLRSSRQTFHRDLEKLRVPCRHLSLPSLLCSECLGSKIQCKLVFRRK